MDPPQALSLLQEVLHPPPDRTGVRHLQEQHEPAPAESTFRGHLQGAPGPGLHSLGYRQDAPGQPEEIWLQREHGALQPGPAALQGLRRCCASLWTGEEGQ